ncbi:DUF99 family protein [archaeon]|nr:DUF99 family protein [archaeon]
MKRQVRAIGFDDAVFFRKDKECLVAGVVCRPDGYVEGVVSTSVKVDGNDATSKIARATNRCRFRPQLKCVFLQGFTVAGFNMADLRELSRLTRLPVISVLRRKPRVKKVIRALKNFSDFDKRFEIFRRNNKYCMKRCVYVNRAGITPAACEELLSLFTLRGNVPEPLRLAHLVASGVSLGESTKNK